MLWRLITYHRSAAAAQYPASNQVPSPGRVRGAVSAFRMVNYYVQYFLPQPERTLVGIDEQFAPAVPPALDLACCPRGFVADPLLVSASDSTQGARHHGGARSYSQRDFDQRQR